LSPQIKTYHTLAHETGSYDTAHVFRGRIFVEEDKILASLFDEGLDNLHLYKPGSSPMYSERLLTLLPEDYCKKITVHDNFYLKEEYNLRGIHISDETTPKPSGYKGHLSRT